MTKPSARFSTKRLTWRDISLGVIMLENGGRIRLTLGLGSGRSQRPNDPKGTVWAAPRFSDSYYSCCQAACR